MIKDAIAEVVAGRNLGREQAAAALSEVMQGRATPAQIAALLVGLRMKGETVDEIVGCVTAMRARMQAVRVGDSAAIDTCGTGGDGAGTFNVSTAVAFVAAGAGATVAKHGNHGVSSGCGSADVLQQAGFALEVPLPTVERSLSEAGIAFLYAPRHHPAVRHAVAPRREIGLRTIFNAMGPLANPAGVTRQVMGVYDRALVVPIARALQTLGSVAVMVVHGADGLDELSPQGETMVAELRDGKVTERTVVPEDAGLSRWPLAAIRGGDAADNLRILRELLDGGGPQAVREAVLLNASAALVVAGRAPDLRQGALLGARALDSGAAREAFARALAINREGTES